MDLGLQGAVAVVAGGTSGMGRAAADCFDFDRVTNAVRCSEIDIRTPRHCVVSVAMANANSGVSFRWIAGTHRLIVHVGVINRVIAVDRDCWISSLRLGMTVWQSKFSPARAGSRTERAALLTIA